VATGCRGPVGPVALAYDFVGKWGGGQSPRLMPDHFGEPTRGLPYTTLLAFSARVFWGWCHRDWGVAGRATDSDPTGVPPIPLESARKST
jgi:hypothetical protein